MKFIPGKLYRYIGCDRIHCLGLWHPETKLEEHNYYIEPNGEGGWSRQHILVEGSIILYIGETIGPNRLNVILHKFLYKDRVYYGSLGANYHIFEEL
jgi:hypothetical protein